MCAFFKFILFSKSFSKSQSVGIWWWVKIANILCYFMFQSPTYDSRKHYLVLSVKENRFQSFWCQTFYNFFFKLHRPLYDFFDALLKSLVSLEMFLFFPNDLYIRCILNSDLKMVSIIPNQQPYTVKSWSSPFFLNESNRWTYFTKWK